MRNAFNFLLLSQSASKARVHIAKFASTAQKSILKDPLKCTIGCNAKMECCVQLKSTLTN